MSENWRLHHDARARMKGQKRRIGRRALVAQRGQHDGLHLVEAVEHPQERFVKPTGFIGLGRRNEFIFETEPVEKASQPSVIVRGEAVIFAERIRNLS